MGAFLVKGRVGLAWWPGCGYRAWGVVFVWAFSGGCLITAAAWPGSSWSARSRAAVRTNELDAGERWPI